MTYAEKLKDPRWQKKRLEILERDNWKCKTCDDAKSTLHVHHFAYKGNPWDAEPGDLTTLCETCHLCIEYLKRENAALFAIKIDKFKLSQHETRLIVITINLSNGNKEVVMVKIFDGKITDGLHLTRRTIDFITTNTAMED